MTRRIYQMPDSRRIQERRCLERSIHGGFMIGDVSNVRFAEIHHRMQSSSTPSPGQIITRHAYPMGSLRGMETQRWFCRHSLFPDGAGGSREPTNCRSALTGEKKERNLGSVWDSHDIATPRPLAGHAHVTVAVVKKSD